MSFLIENRLSRLLPTGGAGTQLVLRPTGGREQQWNLTPVLVPDSTYTIVNKSTGNCICLSADPQTGAVLQGQAGIAAPWKPLSPGTTWTVTNLGKNVVKIVNAATGNSLGCSSTHSPGGPVITQSNSGTSGQTWMVSQSPTPGCFTLTALGGAGNADISGGLGTQLRVTSATGGVTQQWSFR